MKAIIIEDEKRAQIYLKGVINQVAPEIEVVAICDDLPSGVLAIRKFQPEMVFLDIEMPKYNGLEIIDMDLAFWYENQLCKFINPLF